MSVTINPKARGRKPLETDQLKPELLNRSRSRRRKTNALWETAALAPIARNDLRPHLEKIEIAIEDLKYPKSQVRKLEASDIAQVANSIKAFGQVKPILMGHDNEVIDGVVIVEAARQLGLKTVAAVQIGHLTKPEERALRIALNRIGQDRPWDMDILKFEFEELLGLDQTINHLGFSASEIDQIMLSPPPAIPGEPEIYLDENPVTQLGDLWQLGAHKLLCGDAKEEESYDRLLGDDPVQMALTDPPYAVAVDKVVSSHSRDFVEGGGDMTQQEFEQMIAACFTHISRALIEGGMLYCFMDWKHSADLIAIGKALGYIHMNLVTWVKAQGGMGSLYRSQSEFVVVLKKPGQHKNNIQLGKNGRDRTNVWHYAGAGTLGTDAREMLENHPTPKPVTMLVDALLDVTDRGDIVLDPFGGSGSTLIACDETQRIARVIELDPLYCDLIIRRWQEATQQRAILDGNNETFDVVAERRAGLTTLGEADNGTA